MHAVPLMISIIEREATFEDNSDMKVKVMIRLKCSHQTTCHRVRQHIHQRQLLQLRGYIARRWL